MAPIDSILNLVDRQGANELRLGTDKEPKMFAQGEQKKLVIPKTSNETLKELLGELFSKEREADLARDGRVEFLYEAAALGPFRVTLTRRGPAGTTDFDALFMRGKGKGPMPAAASHSPSAPLAPPRANDPAAHVSHAAAAPAPVFAHASAAQVTHTRPMYEAAGAPPPPSSRPRDGASPTPTPELSSLVAAATAMRATNLHLSNGEPAVMRVDGHLQAVTGEIVHDVSALLGLELAAEAHRRISHGVSADFSLTFEGARRCRLNVYETARGTAAALRLFPAAPPGLAELGLPVPLDELIDIPHGLVLVCGPTGSGKSTTLAALAQAALAKRSIMLLTLEDPIEYALTSRAPQSLVRQRQVGRDVRDFATGLRDALREDPDLLLIGEMRDAETIALALTAAETGHLVLASIHSRSAASAIERIIDTYAAERQQQVRVQMADGLRAVVAQRLIPRAKGDGRVVALEVLRVTGAVSNAIREAKTSTITSAIQSGKKEGMLPLERCLADLVLKRAISIEEARAVANDLPALSSYLSG